MDTENNNRDFIPEQETIAESSSFVAEVIEEQKPKSKKILPIIIAVVLLVVAGAVAAVATGAFQKPSDKVLAAIGNTFKPDQVTEKFSAINEITADGKYTMDVKTSVPGGLIGNIDADLSYVQDSSTALQSLKGNIKVLGKTFNVHEYLDDKKLTLSMPELLGEKAISYNYVDKKTGYLVSAVGQKDLDVADAYIQYMHSVIGMDQAKLRKDILNVIHKDVSDLNFEKIAAKEFTLGSGKIDCEGYSVVIDSKFADKFFKDIKAVYGDENFKAYLNSVNSMSALTGANAEMTSEEDIENAIKEMEPVTVNFYINKKVLAAVEFKGQNEEIFSVEFAGEQVPWYDTKFVYDGSTSSLNVKIDGSKETFTFSSDGADLFNITYDVKSGDFSINNDYTEVKGSLKEESGKYIFKVEYQGISLDIAVKSGGTVEKIDAKSIDIGNANEQEINDLSDHVGRVLMGSAGAY